MRTMIRGLVAGVAVAALVAVCVRADEEEKVAIDKLPKAVVDAVKAKFPKAELVSAEKEKEDGETVYEVNIKSEGQTIEVTVTPAGKIVLVEKTIAAQDLPNAVAKALAAKYPNATIKKAEEIIKNDQVTAYEMLIVTADKKTFEVTFDPKGKFIEEEKKSGESD